MSKLPLHRFQNRYNKQTKSRICPELAPSTESGAFSVDPDHTADHAYDASLQERVVQTEQKPPFPEKNVQVDHGTPIGTDI